MRCLKAMAEIEDRDVLHRFLLERSGVRGVLVRLDETWATMRERVVYPPAVQTLQWMLRPISSWCAARITKNFGACSLARESQPASA